MVTQASCDNRLKALILALRALGRRSQERNAAGRNPTAFLSVHVTNTPMERVLAGLKLLPGTTRKWVLNDYPRGTEGDFTACWRYQPASEDQPEWFLFWFDGRDARNHYRQFISDAAQLIIEAGFGVIVDGLREDLRARAETLMDQIRQATEDSPLYPIKMTLREFGTNNVDRLIYADDPTTPTVAQLIWTDQFDTALQAIIR